MACAVCEHCDQFCNEGSTVVDEGRSYHENCHKCYVCGETDLQNAEVFKGVIFCNGCSHRIFQGCSTARKSKNQNAFKKWGLKAKFRGKQRDCCTLQDSEPNTNYSTDTRAVTDVKQELLQEMNCPIINNWTTRSRPVSYKTTKEYEESSYNKTFICSDLRVAELGASTEIAHMPLRRQSELPIVIKTKSKNEEMLSLRSSILNLDSDASDRNGESVYSKDCEKYSNEKNWLDRSIGSLVRLPFNLFKRNILERSSRVTFSMSKDNQRMCIMNRLKMLFREEIVEHQHRGVRRLYSTINRRKIPYKMGWLDLINEVSSGPKCRHFERSHSYRCMRSQVMKVAGPTKSEGKIKKIILAPVFLKNIIDLNKNPAIMMTQACGSKTTAQA